MHAQCSSHEIVVVSKQDKDCICLNVPLYFFGLLVIIYFPHFSFPTPAFAVLFFFLPCFCLHLPLNAKECINSMFVLHCSSCHPAFCRRRAADSRFQPPTTAALLVSCPAQRPQDTTRKSFLCERMTDHWLLQKNWTESNYSETGNTENYLCISLFPKRHEHSPSAVEAVNAAQEV